MKLLLLTVLVSLNAFAVREDQFPQLWNREIAAHFEAGEVVDFTNAQGKRLRSYAFTKPENTKSLVIVPGRSEASIKYAELVYDLRDWGYDLFILDHQGQGFSERLLSDTQKGHVLSFRDYVRDLEQWLTEVVRPRSRGHSFYLLSHSMGGAVSAMFMATQPTFFKRAVLSAPMFEINTDPYSEAVARVYAAFLVKIRRGASYAPGRGPYVPEDDTFAANEVTHSEVRFEASKEQLQRFPEIVVAGATARWVDSGLRATRTIDQLAPVISTPVLLLQAGIDTYVLPGRQRSFCEKHRDCTRLEYGEAFHEILMERDAIRDHALLVIKDFLRN